MVVTFTLRDVRALRPCSYGFKQFKASLPEGTGRDDPILLTDTIKTATLSHLVWFLRSTCSDAYFKFPPKNWGPFPTPLASDLYHALRGYSDCGTDSWHRAARYADERGALRAELLRIVEKYEAATVQAA